MTLTRKDGLAAVLSALAVVVFATTHEGWDVWLIGDSRRWATVAIGLLGIATCALGSWEPRSADTTVKVLAALGVVALVLWVVALVTASLTALSLLVVDIVVLWVASTWRHAHEVPRRHVAV